MNRQRHTPIATLDHQFNGEPWMSVEIQGSLVKVKVKRPKIRGRDPAKRKKIRTFTHAARMRLIKFCNIIDWKRARKCVLVTLTYPSAADMGNKYKRNLDRDSFVSALERYIGRPIYGIWRIEWAPRKSGYEKGIVVPHFHFMFFDIPFIDKAIIRKIWRRRLKANGALCTDIRRAKDRKHIAVYIAKYLAKVPVGCSLDIASYLGIEGRHYGYVHKDLIPVCPVRVLHGLTDGQIDYISSKGIDVLPHLIAGQPESFTLMGRHAEEASAILLEMELDNIAGAS